MLFSKNTKRPLSEEIILNLLQVKNIPSPLLYEKVNKISPCTNQAFYKALRKLQNQEIIIRSGKTLHLNNIWVEKLYNQSSKFLSKNNQQKYSPLRLLQNKEHITYTFKDFHQADAFWGSIFYDLVNMGNDRIPICLYNQHQWSLVVRKSDEQSVFKYCEEHGFLTLLTIAQNTELDKKIMREYRNNLTQINVGSSFNFPKHYYLNIIGDFIIESKLDPSISEQINQWYKKNAFPVTPIASGQLLEILESLSSIKLKITRNKKKAEILRKQLSRDFVVPDNYTLSP